MVSTVVKNGFIIRHSFIDGMINAVEISYSGQTIAGKSATLVVQRTRSGIDKQLHISSMNNYIFDREGRVMHERSNLIVPFDMTIDYDTTISNLIQMAKQDTVSIADLNSLMTFEYIAQETITDEKLN